MTYYYRTTNLKRDNDEIKEEPVIKKLKTEAILENIK